MKKPKKGNNNLLNFSVGYYLCIHFLPYLIFYF